MWRVIGVAAFASVVGGCATTPGQFRDGAWNNEHYSYRVKYAAGDQQLMDSDWVLENFQADEGGRPTVPKEGPDYRHELELDADGDGKLEKVGKIDTFDIRLVNRATAATLWLSTIPVSQVLADTELAVLSKEFVNAVAGAGLRVTRVGDSIEAHQQTYATRIIEEKRIDVDGFAAQRVVFEKASVDQLKLDPNSRWERIAVVLMRPGFFWAPPYATSTKQLFPVLLVAGYSGRPEVFDKGVAAFDAFLSRIVVDATDVSAHMGELLACSPKRGTLRVVARRGPPETILSPDLSADESTCMKKVFVERMWPKFPNKSYVFRSK